MHEATVECNLTARCLQYLTFECFEQNISQDRLHKLAFEGYFVFQDYAIAKWFHHFNGLVACGQDIQMRGFHIRQNGQTRDSDIQDALCDIENALENFCSLYSNDLMQEPIVARSERVWQAFGSFGFYSNLERLRSHISQHEEKDFETKNDISIKELKEVLLRNRNSLEELVASNDISSTRIQPQQLQRFYGDRIFKCPRINCFYFHEGFKDSKSRNDHVNRHDRPFRCAYPDCSMAEFGFANNRDLDKHRRSFHPEVAEEAHTFPSVDQPSSKTPWPCKDCGRQFTRSFAHKNHMRTHRGERPFACPECGRAFTRANDCKRHQKIHARRR